MVMWLKDAASLVKMIFLVVVLLAFFVYLVLMHVLTCDLV